MRREPEPHRGDSENDQDPEDRREPPVRSTERQRDDEQGGREQDIEPFLDRETPGDRIEVDGVGGTEEVLDIEEIADEVRRHQIAGQRRNGDQRDDIGRDGAQPATDQKHAEIALGLAHHPIDDLRGENEAAEDEEDLDAGDRERLRERLKRRVCGEIMRNRDREGRRAAQKIERGAALHWGAV